MHLYLLLQNRNVPRALLALTFRTMEIQKTENSHNTVEKLLSTPSESRARSLCIHRSCKVLSKTRFLSEIRHIQTSPLLHVASLHSFHVECAHVWLTNWRLLAAANLLRCYKQRNQIAQDEEKSSRLLLDRSG